MPKPRSDAKLLNLPEEQLAQLSDWLLSGMPYHKAKALVKETFHVETSLAALSNFYETICCSALIARRQQAVSTADEIATAAQTKPGRFDAATIDALKQKAFELSISPMSNPKDVKNLFSLVLKARDQEIDEKQLSLARDKFQFDAAKAALDKLQDLRDIANNKGLSDEAKLTQARLKLFGELPDGE
jgi:hypothetical protein